MPTELETVRLQLLRSGKRAAIGQLMPGIAHEINNSVASVVSNIESLSAYLSDIRQVLEKQNACIESLRHDSVLSKSSVEESYQGLLVLKEQVRLDFILSDIEPLLIDSLEGAHQVKNIASDLSDFFGQSDSSMTEESLNVLLEKTINVIRNELKYTVRVTRELEDIPSVQCKRGEILQVFFNLLINAAQAIESDGVINLRSGFENGMVWVEISDTGEGVIEENRHKIFNPFFTTKKIDNNLGVGLHNVKTIVEAYGGNVTVVSEKGEGATFRIMLPQHDEKTYAIEK
jgi:two-component system, NtrC family, sensor kinase